MLVSTDVGARGLDIEDVALVVNWDMPDEPEEYTHRVGRTARKGKGGVAVSFVTERDEERVVRVEERIRTKLTEMALPEEKVLEKLNAVSTAKRLANMVGVFALLVERCWWTNVVAPMSRNCMIRSSGSARRSTRSRTRSDALMSRPLILECSRSSLAHHLFTIGTGY